MKKLFMAMCTAVLTAVVSMSVTSCSLGDNEDVDNFSFEYQMDYGTIPTVKCEEMLDTLSLPKSITTSKQNAQTALLGVADSMHNEISKILTSYDKEGYTNFNLTLRLVGDKMGVVASKTWESNLYDNFKLLLSITSESNQALIESSLGEEIETFNSESQYTEPMTNAEAKQQFQSIVEPFVPTMEDYHNALKEAGLNDAKVKLTLYGKRFEDVDSVVWK